MTTTFFALPGKCGCRGAYGLAGLMIGWVMRREQPVEAEQIRQRDGAKRGGAVREKLPAIEQEPPSSGKIFGDWTHTLTVRFIRLDKKQAINNPRPTRPSVSRRAICRSAASSLPRRASSLVHLDAQARARRQADVAVLVARSKAICVMPGGLKPALLRIELVDQEERDRRRRRAGWRRCPGTLAVQCGASGTKYASASVAIFFIWLMPPVWQQSGCRMSMQPLLQVREHLPDRAVALAGGQRDVESALEPLEDLDVAGHGRLLDEQHVVRLDGGGELDQRGGRHGAVGVEHHRAVGADLLARAP